MPSFLCYAGPGPSYYSDLCRRTAVLQSGSKLGLDQIDSDLARVFPAPLPLADEGCEWCRGQEGGGEGDGRGEIMKGQAEGRGEEEEEAYGKARPLDEGEQSDAQTENSEEDPLSADEEGAIDFRVCQGQEGEMDPLHYISDSALAGYVRPALNEEGAGIQLGLCREEGNVAEVLSRMLHALDGQARGHNLAKHSQGPSCYVQVGGPRSNPATVCGFRRRPCAWAHEYKLDSSTIG